MRGIHSKNRFAHRTQCAGKFINILRGGDIACLKMYFGHAYIITLNKAKQDFSIDTSCIFVDMPHNPKVKGNHITVWPDLQITLVHIGMEKSVTQGMI